MKKILVLCLSIFMVLEAANMASAALTFQLDFGQDGTRENFWEMQVSDIVFIDLYVSGIPQGTPNPPGFSGLASMGLDIIYDLVAVEITPGTEFRMDLMAGDIDLTPGHIKMAGIADPSAILPDFEGPFGDDILVGTIEFHCIAPTGITELWLFDQDHGGGFDDWVLFDGTVLDGDISNGILIGEINQTPIPGTLLLFGSGLLGLGGLRRRLHKWKPYKI